MQLKRPNKYHYNKSIFFRSDSEIIGYALDTLYNIICSDEEEEQGTDCS